MVLFFTLNYTFLLLCFPIIRTDSFPLTNNIISSKKIALNLSPSSIQETSDELVNLLLSSEDKESSKRERIRQLVDILVDAKVSFDPVVCLDGQLYFSNVIDGPSPLWERFGLTSGNIQGQQYTYNDDEKSVINYAEILGKAFHVRAYGIYERDLTSSDNEERLPSSSTQERNARHSFLTGLLTMFNIQTEESSRSSFQCPADFVVSVTRGSIFFGANSIDVPIAGTGYLRVLYADPKLRIFISPQSTTDDRWEKAGLTVAQVRADLKYPTFEQLL